MAHQKVIREKLKRVEEALRRKPELGRNTHVSNTKVDQFLTCETTEGVWKLVTDMPRSAAGKGQAPTPGVLGRAALGSCLAMGYMLRAARLDLVFRSIEVEIQADDDDGGLLGTAQVSPGYSEVRYLVRVDTDLSANEVTLFLDECDQRSPWLDVYARAIPLRREIEFFSR